MSLERLIKNFSILRANEPCIFILRHAEKPIANNMQVDMVNAITKEGVKSSKRLGGVLSGFYPKIGIVRSSSVARCLETADNIFSMYPYKILTIPDAVLGGDGAYVSDSQLAAQHFIEDPSRTDIFIKMQNGEIFDGMREIKAGSNLLLAKIISDLEKITAPGFYITHDCILALFVGSMIDQIIDENNWFQYLDGVCIKKTDNKVNLYWENECFDITEKIRIHLESVSRND